MSDGYDVREAALGLTCPFCNSDAGDPCRSRLRDSDGWGAMRDPHGLRMTPLLTAYGNGYADGVEDRVKHPFGGADNGDA